MKSEYHNLIITMQVDLVPPIAKAVHLYEKRTGLKIKIDKDFYQKVEINSKRFGLLVKGRLEPSFNEIKRVALALNISVTDLL